MGVYSVNPPRQDPGQGSLLRNIRGQVARTSESIRSGLKKMGCTGPPGYAVARDPMVSSTLALHRPSSPTFIRQQFESPSSEQVNHAPVRLINEQYLHPGYKPRAVTVPKIVAGNSIVLEAAATNANTPSQPAEVRISTSQTPRESSNLLTQQPPQSQFSPFKGPAEKGIVHANTPSRVSSNSFIDGNVPHSSTEVDKPVRSDEYNGGRSSNHSEGTSMGRSGDISVSASQPSIAFPELLQNSSVPNKISGSSSNGDSLQFHTAMRPSRSDPSPFAPRAAEANISKSSSSSRVNAAARLSKPFCMSTYESLTSNSEAPELPTALRPGAAKAVPLSDREFSSLLYVPLQKEANPQTPLSTQYIAYKAPEDSSQPPVSAKGSSIIKRRPVPGGPQIVDHKASDYAVSLGKGSSTTSSTLKQAQGTFDAICKDTPAELRPGYRRGAREIGMSYKEIEALYKTETTARPHHQEMHIKKSSNVSDISKPRVSLADLPQSLVVPSSGAAAAVAKSASATKTCSSPDSPNTNGPRHTQPSVTDLALYGPAGMAPSSVFSSAVVPRSPVKLETVEASGPARVTMANSPDQPFNQVSSIPDLLQAGNRVRSANPRQAPSMNFGRHAELFLEDGSAGLTTQQELPSRQVNEQPRIESLRFSSNWSTKFNMALQHLKEKSADQSSSGLVAGAPTYVAYPGPSQAEEPDSKLYELDSTTTTTQSKSTATTPEPQQDAANSNIQVRSLARPLAPGQTFNAATNQTTTTTTTPPTNPPPQTTDPDQPNFHWLPFSRHEIMEDPADEHCRAYRNRRRLQRRRPVGV